MNGSLVPLYMDEGHGFLTEKLRVFVGGRRNQVIGVPNKKSSGSISVVGEDNIVSIGEGAYLHGFELIVKGTRCEVNIGRLTWLKGRLQAKGVGSRITIGDLTTVVGFNVISLEGKCISIGRDCMFSNNIEIRNSDAHALIDIATGRRINLSADVRIGDHAWIGARTFIGKGAVLPDDVIVAQGSLINKVHQEGHCVLAGQPAKIVRRGVTWDRHLSTGLELREHTPLEPELGSD